jgi:hypothetical protein
MATHTVTAPSHVPSSSHGTPERTPISDLFSGIVRFFDSLVASQKAVARYERLAHLSDAELGARGLKREDIPRHVFEDIFDRR